MLDSLKGIAAIGIFCIHIGVNNSIFSNRLNHFFSYGNRGVEITYIVSAFLMAQQYYNGNSSTKYPIKLLMKNIANIIPIYYLSIICCELVNVVVKGSSLPLITIAQNLLFLSLFSESIGGSLYFSCLFFTWIIYLIYVKYVNNLKRSVCICLISVLLFMYIFPGVAFNFVAETQYDAVFYMCRCIGSFVVGHMIYFIVNYNIPHYQLY